LWKASFTVALTATLETTLSARTADQMKQTGYIQPREVFALGAANLFCGLLGGMPASAGLSRTGLDDDQSN